MYNSNESTSFFFSIKIVLNTRESRIFDVTRTLKYSTIVPLIHVKLCANTSNNHDEKLKKY